MINQRRKNKQFRINDQLRTSNIQYSGRLNHEMCNYNIGQKFHQKHGLYPKQQVNNLLGFRSISNQYNSKKFSTNKWWTFSSTARRVGVWMGGVNVSLKTKLTPWSFWVASLLVLPRHLCLTCTEINAVITSSRSSIFPVSPIYQSVQLPPTKDGRRWVKRFGPGDPPSPAALLLAPQVSLLTPNSKHLVTSCQPDCVGGS